MTEEIKGPFAPMVLPVIKNIHPMSLMESMTEEDWKKSAENSVRMFQKAFGLIRDLAPEKVAEDILSIDPEGSQAAGKAIKALFEMARPEGELIAQGYEPVCPHTRLMWIKKETPREAVDQDQAEGKGAGKSGEALG